MTREARLIVEGSPLIFREVDRSNEDLVEKCHIWLLFIWIDFIFSHEWAHAYYGHLKLVTGEAKWYELKSHEEVETSPLTHYQLQRIEAHVDRAAGVNLLGHFARYYSEVSETIYGKQEAGRFLRDYILAIFYLFKFFEQTAGRENYDDATHPAPFVRANVFWYFLKLSYPNVAEVPPLSDDDLENIVYSAFLEFYSFEYGFTPAEIINEKIIEVDNFMQTVDVVLRSLDLSTQ